MQTDGQVDMTKVTVIFRNFANAPRNVPSFKKYLTPIDQNKNITLRDMIYSNKVLRKEKP